MSSTGLCEPGLAVVVCIHPARRPTDTRPSLTAVAAQLDPDRDELIVVVDGDDDLRRSLRADHSGAVVVDAGGRGPRAAGVAASTAPVIVFLADDAVPQPGWLDAWRRVFDDPSTEMAGGVVEPCWPAGRAPRWLPDEYGWVVGSDYRGMPVSGPAARRAVGANVAVRRRALEQVGPLPAGPAVSGLGDGHEDTELGIRVARTFGPRAVVHSTSPVVEHQIPAQCGRIGYVLSRCHHEGRSQAALAVDARDEVVAAGHRRVLWSLPSGVMRHAAALLRADLAGPVRSMVLALGLLATVSGLLVGRRAYVPGPAFRPIRILDAELTATTAAPTPALAGHANVMVRFHGLPVGSVRLHDETGDPREALDRAVAEELAPALSRHLHRAGIAIGPDADPATLLATARAQMPSAPRPGPAPGTGQVLVSVVVCTLGTEPRLRGMLHAVLAQTHRNLDVVLVDNDPRSARVRDLVVGVDDPRLRIIEEPARGLSDARNTGLAAAVGPLVAFTDDDALPDENWIAEVVRVFERDEAGVVGCVTGLVTPARLDSEWEMFFEEYGGFDRGYVPKFWSLRPVPDALLAQAEPGERGPLFPYAGGNYGSGNNMTFRTELLRSAGGFDVALGAGSLTRGGEDLDAFRTMLEAGSAIVYTPTALVRHFHRDTEAALRRQMFGYGTGMSAVVFKQLISGPAVALAVLRALPAAGRTLLSPSSTKNSGKSADFPALLTWTELLGYVMGPVLLLRSRRRARLRARAAAQRQA